MDLIILLIIIVTVLLFLLGALVYRLYAKYIAKVDISFALSCRILFLGFAGCAVFSIIFGILGTALGAVYGAAPGTFCDANPLCLFAFIFGPIGVQSFIYFFMTKSLDGVQITRLHAFILSIIFLVPGFISVMAGIFAMAALIENF